MNSLKEQGGVLSELIWLAGFIWLLIFFQFKPECQSFLSSINPADYSIGSSVLNYEWAPARLSLLPIYLINTKWGSERPVVLGLIVILQEVLYSLWKKPGYNFHTDQHEHA